MENEAEHRIPSPIIEIQNIVKLIRLIMCGNPRVAESVYGSRDFINQSVLEGVKVLFGSKERLFIVIDGQTKFTTAELPEKYLGERLVHIPETKSLLLKEMLTERVDRLYTLMQPPEKLNFRRILEWINDSYASFDGQNSLLNTRLIGFLSDALIDEEPETEDQVEHWAKKWHNELITRIMKFEFCSQELIDPFFVFLYFLYTPNKLLVYRMMLRPIRIQLLAAIKNKKAIYPTSLLVAFNMDTYLQNPNFSISHKAAIFKGAGILIHQRATDLRREADKEMGFVLFYNKLYQASFYYAAAQSIIKSLFSDEGKTLLNHNNSWSVEELRKIERNSEEMKVLIQTSFVYCIDDGSKFSINFTDPLDVFAWFDDYKNAPLEEVEGMIIQYASEMMMPALYKDYFLGYLYCQYELTAQEGIERLERFTTLIEKNLLYNICIGDPNYLSSAYSILASTHNKLGNGKASELYKSRSTRYYFDKRMEEACKSTT